MVALEGVATIPQVVDTNTILRSGCTRAFAIAGFDEVVAGHRYDSRRYSVVLEVFESRRIQLFKLKALRTRVEACFKLNSSL